jgi:hypothetical protein
MVKRAVGTKACLLGKAVTCKYLRRDNFLEVKLPKYFSIVLPVLGMLMITAYIYKVNMLMGCQVV